MSTELVFIDEKMPLELEVLPSTEGPCVSLDGEDIPLVDVVFPITIVQPGHLTIKENKSKYTAHKGKFYNEVLEESASELRLLPLAVLGHGRRLYGPYDPNNTDLLCYSLDGSSPADKVEYPISESCGTFSVTPRGEFFTAVCPKAVWVDGKKPECSESLTVAFFDIDNRVPVEMQLTGTQISAWNNFKKSYKQKKNAARIKKKSIHDFVILATIEDEGTYASIKFTLENMGDENPGKYAPLMKYYWENLFVPLKIQREAALSLAQGGGDAKAIDYDVNITPAEVEPAAAEAAGEDFTMD